MTEIKPGTRWREYKTYGRTASYPHGYRSAGLNPTYIIAATDDWVIYVHKKGFAEDAPQIGGERARGRAQFLEEYEPSCCETHDQEPFNPKPCDGVIVPDRGVYVVKDGKIYDALRYDMERDPYGCTERIDVTTLWTKVEEGS